MELQNIIDILDERVSSLTNMIVGEFETIDPTKLTLEEKEKFLLDKDVEISYTKKGYSAKNNKGGVYATGTKEDVFNATYLRLVYFPIAQRINKRIDAAYTSSTVWANVYENVVKNLDGSHRQCIEREDVTKAVTNIVKEMLSISDLEYRLGIVSEKYKIKRANIEEFLLGTP